MAKNDRCQICDYSEQFGSHFAGTNPGDNGRVRQHPHGMFCDSCTWEIHEVILEGMAYLTEEEECG